MSPPEKSTLINLTVTNVNSIEPRSSQSCSRVTIVNSGTGLNCDLFLFFLFFLDMGSIECALVVVM